jgi:hypothetical protein
MTHVAKLGLFPLALAKQAAVGVRGRGMHINPAPFAMEFVLGIARAARWPSACRRHPWGTKMFMLAHASISVPSTEKCSLKSSLRSGGRLSTAARNLAAISPSSGRSRVLQKAVGSQTGLSLTARQIVVELVHQMLLRTHACNSKCAVGIDGGPPGRRARRRPAPVPAPHRPARGSPAKGERPQYATPTSRVAEQPHRPLRRNGETTFSAV